MIKEIIEFVDSQLISLQAVQLSVEDLEKIRFELSTFKELKFTQIDSESIRAEISNPSYNEIEKLESLGWSFI